MKHLDDILKLAENELEAIVKNGKFRSREEIDSVYKLIDIAKDSYEIWCMEDDMDSGDDYSRDYGRSRYDGHSYARKRDSMGRYSRDYDGRSMRGYSRDGKDEYKENLRRMMEDAPDEATRQSIKRMLDNM